MRGAPLYALIALVGWLARLATEDPAPTLWWAAQMALNFLWTAACFGSEAPLVGLVVIALLVAAVTVDLVVSYNVRPLAGWLLVPYLLWVLFATALNIGIVVLNDT